MPCLFASAARPTVLPPRDLGRWASEGVTIMKASVAESTAATYKVGWNKWTEFARLVDVSPMPDIDDSRILVNGIYLPSMVALTIAFCAYSFKQARLKPSSICGYLAGVAFFLKLSNHDHSFLQAPAVQMSRAGMKRLQVTSETVAYDTWPFTLDMILHYQQFSLRANATFAEFGIFVCMLLAFSCLLRRSEYIPTDAQHFIRACDVTFRLSDDSIVESQDANYINCVSITEIVVLIPSSKRDQDRKGYRFVFARDSPSSSNLCEALVSFAVRTRKLPEDPFLSTRDSSGKRIWCINACDLTEAMRAVGRSLGFSAAQVLCIVPHALRYGGASTLLAAGVDKYQVQLAGRWKSDAFMVYLLASHSVFERTQTALANPSWLSYRSVKLVI